ncbi:type II toxin-antitoxin system HicB family antitoxin [Nitrosospira multiformis]|uniref:type II toxin-antitoxin system HicB family antitoxin n=1 Tax=Nitrosospira multiformis TaxID=1231 RepID=UPI0009BD5EEA
MQTVQRQETKNNLLYGLRGSGCGCGCGKISFRTVRLNISLPEGLLSSIDEYARAHHMTRFGFLAKAAQDAMRVRVSHQ